jgi:hypothetical protein
MPEQAKSCKSILLIRHCSKAATTWYIGQFPIPNMVPRKAIIENNNLTERVRISVTGLSLGIPERHKRPDARDRHQQE